MEYHRIQQVGLLDVYVYIYIQGGLYEASAGFQVFSGDPNPECFRGEASSMDP